MAQGFKDIQVPVVKEDAGYETIFEKVKAEAGGETKSYMWYRTAIRKYALRINDNPEKLIRDEIQDSMGPEEHEDANKIINFPRFKVKKFLREDTVSYSDFGNKDGVLRNNSSSIHLILNLLWLNKVNKIYTLGVTDDHYSWNVTKRLMDMYNISYERL